MITGSGGFGVIQADLCHKAGIEVPRFGQETIDSLRAHVPIAGTSIANPLDAWPIFYNVTASPGNFAHIIKVVASDGKIHSLIFYFEQFRYMRRILGSGVEAHLKLMIDQMLDGCLYARDILGKPMMACVPLDPYLEDEEERKYNLMIKKAFVEEGFPVYTTAEGAIQSLANLYSFSTRLRHG